MTQTHFSPPGGILKRHFLDGFGLSVSAAARAMEIPRSRLNQIVRGERAITADTALRLGQFFDNGAQFWLNLQTHYDLSVATKTIAKEVRRIPKASQMVETQMH